MQTRGLLIGALLLAILSGGVWYSNKLEKDKEGKPAPDAPPKLVEIQSGDISQIEIAKGAETTAIKRNAGNNWELTSPKAFRADQESANSLASTFGSLASDRLVEEKPSDLGGFGLATPAIAVTVTKKDGKKTKLLLGDETPTSGGVFAKLDGDPRVFTLASFNKSSLDKSFKDLQDKRLLTADTDKLSRVELVVKGQTVEFGKNTGNEWAIVKPKPMRADGGNVEELVRKLKEAKMDPAISDDDAKKAATAFAGAAPVATARVTDSSGTQQLEVRKSKDNAYYAKSSAVEGIHKVTNDLGDGLNKSPDDFRMKKIFEFGWSDPTRVEVKDAGVTRSFVKEVKDKDSKWKEGAAEMDAISVQGLIDKLRDLSATKFLDKGAGTPIFEASVTSNEGKRNEKVLISKTGDKYYAVRDNEPAVYEIDTKAFEDLQKAAKDVKPPTPVQPSTAKDGKKK